MVGGGTTCSLVTWIHAADHETSPHYYHNTSPGYYLYFVTNNCPPAPHFLLFAV